MTGTTPSLPTQVSPPEFALSGLRPHAILGVDVVAVPVLPAEGDGSVLLGPGALERSTSGGRHLGAGHVPFTVGAKKALELALREAIHLGHRSSGPSTSCSASCGTRAARRRGSWRRAAPTASAFAPRCCVRSRLAATGPAEPPESGR